MGAQWGDRWPLSLRDLHALVPAAEAIDLLEQDEIDQARAETEEVRRHIAEVLNQLGSDEVSGGEPPPSNETEPEADGSEDTLTRGQAIGMLEHLLGAEPIDPEDPAPQSRR